MEKKRDETRRGIAQSIQRRDIWVILGHTETRTHTVAPIHKCTYNENRVRNEEKEARGTHTYAMYRFYSCFKLLLIRSLTCPRIYMRGRNFAQNPRRYTTSPYFHTSTLYNNGTSKVRTRWRRDTRSRSRVADHSCCRRYDIHWYIHQPMFEASTEYSPSYSTL